MRILITGATGFVGRNLIPNILKQNSEIEKIALLTRDENKSLNAFKEYKEIKHINLLSSDYKGEINKFNPEIVLHLASHLTSQDDEDNMKKLLNANIEFGTNLLDALKGTDIKYFINVGTFSEYYNNDGELNSSYLYAATKTAFRAIIKYYKESLGFNWINIVPYTIYGGEDTQKKVVDYVISSLKSEKSVAMSAGEQRLDFIHISDVTEFFVNLINRVEEIKQEYIEFHLGTGTGTSIRELAGIVEKIFNKSTNINWGELPYRKNDIMQAIADSLKNKEILNWEPKIDLKSGINKIKEEMYKNE